MKGTVSIYYVILLEKEETAPSLLKDVRYQEVAYVGLMLFQCGKLFNVGTDTNDSRTVNCLPIVVNRVRCISMF